MRRKSLVHDILPHGDRDESRFSPEFEVPFTSLDIEVVGDPSIHRVISRVEVLDGHRRKLDGSERLMARIAHKTRISRFVSAVLAIDPTI
jgi:hypothetical protein